MCFVQSLKQQQGGNDSFGVHCPTKTAPLECDIRRGRSLDVPAIDMATRLSPKPRTPREFAWQCCFAVCRLVSGCLGKSHRHPDPPRKCEWWCQPILRVCVCVCVCVCVRVCVWGWNSVANNKTFDSAGGPRAHHTARANEALHDAGRKTHLQTSSWVPVCAAGLDKSQNQP